MSHTIVAALYQFVALPDYQALRPQLLALCKTLNLKGTLLLAAEGINGTVAGSREGIDGLKAWLAAEGRFNALTYKESEHENPPFMRLKVKLKNEIVTLGVPGTDPTRQVGHYADVDTWNTLIDDPDTLVIDTRNDYEVAIGKFRDAVSPNTRSFREFPDYVEKELDPARHKRVAMYCTGGIRCEKASHYLLQQGFEEVWHLKGGILQYLEEVSAAENRWEGECFVFDERVAVDSQLQAGEYRLCRACRHPVSSADRASSDYEEGVSCPHCRHGQTEDNRARARERWRQIQLAEQRGESHIGPREPDDR